MVKCRFMLEQKMTRYPFTHDALAGNLHLNRVAKDLLHEPGHRTRGGVIFDTQKSTHKVSTPGGQNSPLSLLGVEGSFLLNVS